MTKYVTFEFTVVGKDESLLLSVLLYFENSICLQARTSKNEMDTLFLISRRRINAIKCALSISHFSLPSRYQNNSLRSVKPNFDECGFIYLFFLTTWHRGVIL